MRDWNRDDYVVAKIALIGVALYAAASVVILPAILSVLRIAGVSPAICTVASTTSHAALWLILPLAIACAVARRVESAPVKRALVTVLFVALLLNGAAVYSNYSLLLASQKTTLLDGFLVRGVVGALGLVAMQVALAGITSWSCARRAMRSS